MHFSTSSIFITLCMSALMITCLFIILTSHKFSKFFRSDFLTGLIFIIILRLFLPFELFFTKSIPAPTIMNPLMDFLNFKPFNVISIISILISIWLIGILVKLYKYIKSLKNICYILKYIENTSTKTSVSTYLKDYQGEDYFIFKTDFISSPMVLGHKKYIMIPNTKLKKSVLKNILLHEIRHIKNHDFYLKQFVNVLCIIYWWFPPIYILQKKLDLIIEVRVDNQVIKHKTQSEILDYTQSLIDMQKEIMQVKKNNNFDYATFYINDNSKILEYRLNYLLNFDIKQKTNKILLSIIVILPILSNSIILEAYNPDSNKLEDTWTTTDITSDGYLIEHKDGSYSLCIDDKATKIKDYDYFIELGMKVEKE